MNASLFPMKKLPLWLKIAFTVWMLAWVPSYSSFYGPQNFLWLCDLCNFIILIALWTESGLLFSSQIVAVLVIDILWSIDVFAAFAFGAHPIGGTEYMFNPAIPLPIRLLSLFHVLTPPLLVYAVLRLGYDRRGILLQTALTWIILPLSYLLTDPERNINWVFGLFNGSQTLFAPWTFVLLCMAAYPLLLYLPTHALVLGASRHCASITIPLRHE